MKSGISLLKRCDVCKINFYIDKYELYGNFHSDSLSKYICTRSESVFEVRYSIFEFKIFLIYIFEMINR